MIAALLLAATIGPCPLVDKSYPVTSKVVAEMQADCEKEQAKAAKAAEKAAHPAPPGAWSLPVTFGYLPKSDGRPEIQFMAAGGQYQWGASKYALSLQAIAARQDDLDLSCGCCAPIHMGSTNTYGAQVTFTVPLSGGYK